jgi:DNA repair exonuclease SbcCD nuclease subunit
MKLLAFTDLHIGKKGANSFFLDLDKKIIDIICADAKTKKIEKIIFLGDLMHSRSESSPKALCVARYCLDQLNNLGIPIIMILGNHDTFYNSSKEFNYYRIFSGLFPNITFVENILEDDDLLYVGWMQTTEEESAYKEVSPRYKWIFGHFEFKGSEMSEYYKTTSGLENTNPEAYIFSGHIHQRSRQGRLHYMGSPYPQTWHGKNRKDYGYVIIDTENEGIEYVDLGVYHFNEYKLQKLLMQIKMDKEHTKQEMCNSDTRIKIDVPLSEKQLMDVKMFLNTFHPRSMLVERETDAVIVDDIKYDSLSLSNPVDFIRDYIVGMKLEESQKSRVLEKVINILEQ